MKTGVVQCKYVGSDGVRLDSKFHLSDGIYTKRLIMHSPYSLKTVGCFSSDVFYGNRAKRIYVNSSDKGIPFIGSSDMLKLGINDVKLISKKYTQSLDSLTLKKGWILISRSGTIGNTVYTNDIFENKIGSEHIIRVIPNINIYSGFLYSYLSSTYGYSLLTQGTFGAVIQHIEPSHIDGIPVPVFPESKQKEIHNLIVESANLRVEAIQLLEEAKNKLLSYANLPQLMASDYDYFGSRSNDRTVSCFSKNIKEIDSTTINAFNHSSRIEKTKQQIKNCCQTIPLEETLDDKKIFSTGSFPRVEIKSEKGIMLINQKDIFDTIIKGKRISRRKVKTDNLVEYGEVLIAGVGTLGESETFCRAIFANEDLQSQLISGEFIRMKTNENYLSGYLFAWLNTNYGFRLIRNTQAGTKLCRPIPRLLLQIPIPLLEDIQMAEIDKLVKTAHTLHHSSNKKEIQAISLVEKEIESWQQS